MRSENEKFFNVERCYKMESMIKKAKRDLKDHHRMVRKVYSKRITRNLNLENDYRIKLEDRIRYLQSVDLIGYICIQRNLPGGDPPFMSKMIAGYIN